MNINLEGRLYKKGDVVYIGYTKLLVINQRGRQFITYKGKQRNLKDIPVLPTQEPCPLHEYVFGNMAQRYPCPAMGYWFLKYRQDITITVSKFKEKYL